MLFYKSNEKYDIFYVFKSGYAVLKLFRFQCYERNNHLF